MVAGKCFAIEGTAESYQSFKNQLTVTAKEQSIARAYHKTASRLNSIFYQLIKHHRLVAINQHTVLKVPANGRCQYQLLQVSSPLN